MCGIFGAISFRNPFAANEYSRFVALTDAVDYRGPDDRGYQALRADGPQEPGAPFDIFLGSRRLAIIDVSQAGHQPMSDGEGRWITFNGEIFNYLELRDELQQRGHHFRTNTDTEVLLHVYAEFGEEGFARLNGMWAFAIADLPRRKLILSRDRFSIKPLYLLRAAQQMYFGSEIKQLLPLLDRTELHEQTMAAFLGQGLLDHSEKTFFAGIERVPARTTLIVDLVSGDIRRQQYWSFPRPSNGSHERTEEFRELLMDSVRIRLRSDVPVGILLSGGLDSSAIAVLGQKLAGDAVTTYSIVSDSPCSEERFVDALAERGLRTQKIKFEASDVVEDLDRALHHSDEPFGGFSVLAQYKLLKAVRERGRATVLLSGQGADEVLLGYLKFFFFHLNELARQGRILQAAWQVLMSAMRRTVVRQFTIGQARRYLPITTGQHSWVLSQYRAAPIWQCRSLRERQIADIELYSVPALTHYEDRNSSAHSLEVRNPFLDHRLVELLVNLPPQSQLHDGWTKYVLRAAVPELPDAIRWRRDKQPFITPEKEWLTQSFAREIENRFEKSALARMGMIDAHRFLRSYRDFRRGAAIPSGDIARTLIAETWAQKFVA